MVIIVITIILIKFKYNKVILFTIIYNEINYTNI